MKYMWAVRALKTIAIGFLVGWFAGDVIQLCQGDMRPLSRKGVQFMYITQTQQHETDTLGTLEKETTLLGFRITLMH
jgi:hypothetical protein